MKTELDDDDAPAAAFESVEVSEVEDAVFGGGAGAVSKTIAFVQMAR
jgi:hypothetical protein